MTASGVEADIGGIGGLEHLLIERCFMSASGFKACRVSGLRVVGVSAGPKTCSN